MKYEFTRAIQFNLSNETKSLLHPDGFGENFEKVASDFQQKYRELLDVFERAVFEEKGDDKKIVKQRLEIKKAWIRHYAKEDFYRLKETERKLSKYTIAEAKFLDRIFNDWLERNKNILEEMDRVFFRLEWEKARKSDLSLLTRILYNSDYFFFVRDFTMPGVVNDKDSDMFLAELQKIVSVFEPLIENLIYLLSPEQRNGIEIARASFNYYTVNKISKNFDKDIEEKKKYLKQPYNLSGENSLFLKKVGFSNYMQSENINLQDLYVALKNFKSKQKTSFMEAVQKKETAQNIQQKFPLFQCNQGDTMQKFVELSSEIENLSIQKNQSEQLNNRSEIIRLAGEIEEKSKKRGSYFQNRWGFNKYIEYCDNIYKPIAMKIGRLRAEIRAIEQEKIEARLLRYWAHIVQKNNKYFLLLIPKENMQNAKIFLDNIKTLNDNREHFLYSFNSLTLRALNKLIRRNLGKEQTRLKNEAVELYKETLKRQHRQLEKIDFSGFDNEIKEVIKNNYQNEEEFRIDLERVAYYRSKKYLKSEDVEKLKNDFGALLLEVSSYDLERDITAEEKKHTKLWQDFWSNENSENSFQTRLNPEIRIFYRAKRIQNNFKKQKNRFSKDHFGVTFTVTQNAAQKKMETAFVKEKDLLEMIKRFNDEIIEKFIKEKGDNLYYYGIDRGQQELATLGVVKFSKEQYEAMLASGEIERFDKPIFSEIETYRIKDECLHNKKEIVINKKGEKTLVTLFKNPSHFIIDEDILEKVSSPFIDLTTAKLIKGKIVLNGDIQTYIGLKKANSKRQLFEKLSKIDPEMQIEFDEGEKRFQIKSKDLEHEKYQFLSYYFSEQEKIFSREEMRRELQEYLDKLRNNNIGDEEITIEKINNLRDAITANMVGIIAFLFDKYQGIINLENLHSKNEIERHFNKSNENISRRLEWSLYKKFQKFGLVPPKLRQTIFFRENSEYEKINQFGIIHFIPTEKTSACCPYCGESTPKQQREKDKFENHAYVCRSNYQNCGFDTRNPKKPLELIKNSDDAAAYNIAKEKI